MQWKEALKSYLSPNYTISKVAGQEVKFYPIGPSLLFKLKHFGRPIAQAMATMAAKSDKQQSIDRGKTIRTVKEVPEGVADEHAEALPTVLSETLFDPISADVMQFRADQTERSIDRLIDEIFKEENQLLIVEIIFNSCRDLFPRAASQQDYKEFLEMDGMDVGHLAEFLTGVMKANEAVFGPLGLSVPDEIKEQFKTKVGNPQGSTTDSMTPMSSPTESVETPTVPLSPSTSSEETSVAGSC